MSNEEENVTFEIDLSDALVAAGEALYEASDEYDSAKPYDLLSETDRDAFEATAGVVLEVALPELIQQVVDQLAEDDDVEDEDE